MKFAYIDESGTGGEPVGVMAALLVDTQRMGPTKREWDEFLVEVSRIAGKPIRELHTRDFYPGNGPWHGVSAEKRVEITEVIISWIGERRHHVVVTGAIKADFEAERKAGLLRQGLNTLWMAMATHMLLSLQKEGQRHPKNKGNTVVIFDEHGIDKESVESFVDSPPEWSDSYYNKSKKQSRLDQIVDVPYFCSSEHVAMVQVADFVSFFVRKHIELTEGYAQPKYPEEPARLAGWFRSLSKRLIPMSSIYPKTGRCEIGEMFFRLAPPTLRTLK
jgi:hypothetical protein